jgi:hypothetical protein
MEERPRRETSPSRTYQHGGSDVGAPAEVAQRAAPGGNVTAIRCAIARRWERQGASTHCCDVSTRASAGRPSRRRARGVATKLDLHAR